MAQTEKLKAQIEYEFKDSEVLRSKLDLSSIVAANVLVEKALKDRTEIITKLAQESQKALDSQPQKIQPEQLKFANQKFQKQPQEKKKKRNNKKKE